MIIGWHFGFDIGVNPSILATNTTEKRQLIITAYTRLHDIYNL